MFDASVAVTAAAADVAVQDHSLAASIDARPVALEAAPASARHDVVFVDGNVAGASQIAQTLPSGTEVVMLDGSKDGFAQMAAYLSGRHDIDSIALISHGSMGAVQAGSVWLTSDTLAQHADALKAIGASLSESGDLLLYGCRVGQGTMGQQLLDQVAALTSADVAGSTDDTGAAGRGGNWTLERSTGSIEARSLQQDAALVTSFDGLLTAPGYENFDTVVLPDGQYYFAPAAGYDLNNWTFQVLLSNGSTDPNAQIVVTNQQVNTDLANNANDKALILDSDQNSLTSYTSQLVLKATSGENFNFHSITVQQGLSNNVNYRLIGYQDGVQVSGATQDFQAPVQGATGAVISVSGSAWENVDEIRIITTENSGSVSLWVDDINISAAPPPNAPPAITQLNGDSVTFTEKGAPVLLDVGANVTVTDGDSTDFNGGNLTVNIITNRYNGVDELVIQSQTIGADQISVVGQNVLFNGNVIGTFSGGTGTDALVVTFNSAFANSASVAALMKSIAFNNTSSDPGTLQRTVSFTLNDGDGVSSSTAALTTVNVTKVNDAPTVTASPQTPTYTENGAGVALFSGTSASTVESGQGFTALTWTVNNVSDGSSEILRIDGTDVLLVNGTSVNTSTFNAGVTVSVSGGVATVSLNASSPLSGANVASLLNGMTYRDTSDNPTGGPRTVTLTTARDNGGTSDGGSDTALLGLASTVTVVAVNDAPVVTTTGGSASFTAGDNTASTPIVVDSGLTLSDVDSTTMSSATVRITGNFQPGEDVLSFVNSNSTLYGNITASFNAGTGTMTLSSAGSTATISQWQAALRSVRYTDTAVTPNTATRTISFTVNDGSNDSVTATRNVTVTAVDQTPLISTSNGAASFIEGQGAVAVDAGISVSDLDNTTLSSAQVQIVGNFNAAQDALGFINSSAITYGNIVGSYNSSTGVLTLSSAGSTASVTQWQAALQSVSYLNSSSSPDVSTRTVSYVISDGVKTSAAATRDISVSAVATPPVLGTSGGSITFTEGNQVASTPVVVDAGLTVSDADNTTFAAAAVAVTGNFEAGSDVLSFINSSAPVYGNIIATYDAATGLLSMSSAGGTATVAQWQAALRAVTYTSTSDAPSTAARTISFIVDDGAGGLSNTGSRTVNVVSVDDSPVITGGSGTAVFAEADNAAASPVAIDPGLTLSDADSATLTTATVTITGNLHTGEDLLAFTNTSAIQFGNIIASYDPTSGMLSLSSAGGTATVAQWEAALRAVTYANTSEAPNTAGRVISFVVNDGNSDSSALTRSVTVTSANDTPVNTVPSAVQHVDQDSTLVFGTAQGNAISLSDADAGNGLMQVTLTVTQGTLSLSGTNGLSFVTGTGRGDATMTFTGSLADINAALQGLSFAPTAGYHGDASLQITTNDLGNGGGPARTDTDTLTLSVDPTNPVISSISTTTPDGGYKVGDTITTTITFDQAVTVDLSGGTPSLLLETGAIDRQAVYVSGSGTNTLTFRYVVQAGDVATRLDYASTGALALNGGSIRSATQFDALLALPAPGSADSLAATHAIQVDGVAPVVTGVRLPAAGTYVAGQTLDFTVDYSEAVTLATNGANGAAPRLAVTLDGGRVAYADYVSGSGSSSLVFRLTVQAGQQASGGITVAGSVDANGAVLRDSVGNLSGVTLVGLGSTAGIRVDAVLPSVSSITRLDGSATSGQPVRYQVTFSETVTGVDAADFRLSTTGNASATITGVTRVDGSTYVVEVGQVSGAGQISLALAAANSAIADSAGNALSTGAEGPAYAVAPIAPPPLPPVEPPMTLTPPVVPPVEVASQTPVTFDVPAGLSTGLVIPNPVLITGLDTSPGTGNSGNAGNAISSIAAVFNVPLLNNPLDPNRVYNPVPAGSDSRTADVVNTAGRSFQGLDRPTSVAIASGEPVRIALPVDLAATLNPDNPTTVEVRLSNGRPLPAWLRYDPVTGTLVGKAPAGMNQKISIEFTVRDAKGQRSVSTIELEIKSGANQRGASAEGEARVAALQSRAADAGAPADASPTAGRPGLASQFSQHGRGAWQAERQHWEQVLTDAGTPA